MGQVIANGLQNSTNMDAKSFKAMLERANNEDNSLRSDEELEKIYNSESWKEPREGIVCPICHNREYIFTVRKGEVSSRYCSCFKIREAIKRMRELGLERQIEKCTFESYQTPHQWQKIAKETALQFVENENRQWILFAGQSGAGKTHLAVATAFKLLQKGFNLYYMLWLRDATKLKANINDTTTYENMIIPFRRCKVLYIDDFWKCKRGQAELTDADVRLAYDILDYRYNNDGRITILSTEWTLEDLIRIDEAVGGRIFEKTKDSQIVLEGQNKNWRIYGGQT